MGNILLLQKTWCEGNSTAYLFVLCQIGFLYASVLEDYITGFHMHCKGWKSIYYDPLRPQFLGSSPINLNDILVQWKRWSSGLLEVAFSRFCPLTYGIISRNPILHTICYGYVAFLPLYSIFALCYATVPPLCLLNGISLYPKVKQISTFEVLH